MKHYINQLISDIRKTTHNIRPPRSLWDHADVNSELELEDMAFLEKYFEGEEEAISEITGIAPELLPPPAKLSIEQQALLGDELERLLQHFNFYLDFPDQLPAHLKYPVIIDFWKEEHVLVSFGKNEIELCDMEKEHCPFPGHCNICDEVAAQMKYDEEKYGDSPAEETDIDRLLPSPQETEEWYKKQKGFDPDAEDSVFPADDNIEDNENFEDINGFYDDDGTKIDPDSVPVPSLCVICKKHLADDWEENLLCLMNRYDQRNDEDFNCGAFEKI